MEVAEMEDMEAVAMEEEEVAGDLEETGEYYYRVNAL